MFVVVKFLFHFLLYFFFLFTYKCIASIKKNDSINQCAKSRNVDLYVLHDVSSSMNIHNAEVRYVWYNFLSEFLDTYENARVAIGEFSDKDVKYPNNQACYKHLLNFTRSKKDIHNIFRRSEEAFHGGDTPEDVLTSMAQASLNDNAGWRYEKNSFSDVISILLVITDAKSHVCYDPTSTKHVIRFGNAEHSLGACYSDLRKPYSCTEDYYITYSAFKKALELRKVLPVMMLYKRRVFWEETFAMLRMNHYIMNADTNVSMLHRTMSALLKKSLCYAEKEVFLPEPPTNNSITSNNPTIIKTTLSTTTKAPPSTTTKAPSSTTTKAPRWTTTKAPPSTTTKAPRWTTTKTPPSTTTKAFPSTTTKAPRWTTTKAPPSTTTKAPRWTTTKAPPSTTTKTPRWTTTKAPPSTTTKTPRWTTTKTPPSTTTKTPPSTTTKTPPSTTTKTPPTTIKAPPSTTTKTPPSTTTKTPPSTTTKTPPSATTKTPPSTTTKAPPSTTIRTPPSTTTKTPPSTTTEVSPPTITKIPPSTTTKIPPSTTTKASPSTTTKIPAVMEIPSDSKHNSSLLKNVSSSLMLSNATEKNEKNDVQNSSKKEGSKTIIVWTVAATTSLFAMSSLIFIYYMTIKNISFESYNGEFETDANLDNDSREIVGEVSAQDFF